MSIGNKRKKGESSAQLGRRLKEIRNSRKLRMTDVASASGLAVSTISKVENGRMSLTYDKLLQLAGGLGIELTELLSAPQATSATGPEASMVTGRRSISRATDGVYVKTRWYEYWYLGTELSRKAMTPIVGRTSAKSIDEFGPLIRHAGQEFVYVLEGSMILHTEFYAPARLNEGDSIYFDSGMGHAYLTASERPCRFLVVCSDPDIFPTPEQIQPARKSGKKRAGRRVRPATAE